MIKPFIINKIKQKKMSNIWKLTDEVIEIKDVVEDIIPDFSSSNMFKVDSLYTCMRDMSLNTVCIYIKKEDVEKFKDIKLVYDKERNFVNLTLLKNYVLSKDSYCVVADRVVPQAVNIKLLYYCNIMDINLYIQRTFRLQQDATLFKELLNVEHLKIKHNLRELKGEK